MNEEIMNQPIDTTWEIDKDDPIWLWIENYCEKQKLSYENLDMIALLKDMPREMSKEFLRRMITSQAIPGLSAKELVKITKLGFTKRGS